jgi:ribosomal protein S18 acetylase RimI-like enzyme
LIPVDYQDSFFLDIAQSKAPFFSFCCIADNGSGHFIGFVTAKVVPLAGVPHNDQQCLLWALKQSAGDSPRQAAYITTIGVYPDYQRQGIATNLLKLVCQVSPFWTRHGVFLRSPPYRPYRYLVG